MLVFLFFNLKIPLWSVTGVQFYSSVNIFILFETFFREAKLRRDESKPTGREKYRGDKDSRDDRRQDRDERRHRERSPVRHDRHKAGTYRAARDTEHEEKWRRRPERDDEGRERLKNDTTRFVRPTDSDNR